MDRSIPAASGEDEALKLPVADLRRALQSVRPSRLAAALEAAVLASPRPSAALAGLLFVRWAEGACGGRLPRAERAALESIQAHLLAWSVLRDRIADGGAGDERGEAAPLFATVRQRLQGLFPPRSRFWKSFRLLEREQSAADGWEQTGAGPVRFDASLIRRLGRKSALGRWPAAAVAELLGRPRMTRRVDRDFDDLLAALQLFDDVADAEEDARSGQTRIVRGIPLVCAAARARLRRLASRAGGMGRFARRLLEESVGAERRAIEAAGARGLASFLQRALEGLGPVSAARH
ncbi:MAG: hypothetical protein E6J88_15690 [Deltaproteobacteria bacterium]|nr:MAG: hypothetical protein E6J88_15690 [Deltaproteobacteria bacterium]